MKRKFSIFAVILLALALVACQSNEKPVTNDSAQSAQTDSSQSAQADNSKSTQTDNSQSAQADNSKNTENTTEEKSDRTNSDQTTNDQTNNDRTNTDQTTAGQTNDKESDHDTSDAVNENQTGTEEKYGTEDSSTTEDTDVQEKSKVLVIYFSATGTTAGIGRKIANITGADIYEIKAAQEYTAADLNWNDSDSRTTKEQDDPSARPEIGSNQVSLDGYTTIFIGYPIWWGEEPRIMDTFVESYDFGGITMIPFCTSGSSGIGRSGRNLADKAGSGRWLDGKRFGAGASEDSIRSWIEGIQ